jgi:hypothetical protein
VCTPKIPLTTDGGCIAVSEDLNSGKIKACGIWSRPMTRAVSNVHFLGGSVDSESDVRGEEIKINIRGNILSALDAAVAKMRR